MPERVTSSDTIGLITPPLPYLRSAGDSGHQHGLRPSSQPHAGADIHPLAAPTPSTAALAAAPRATPRARSARSAEVGLRVHVAQSSGRSRAKRPVNAITPGRALGWTWRE